MATLTDADRTWFNNQLFKYVDDWIWDVTPDGIRWRDAGGRETVMPEWLITYRNSEALLGHLSAAGMVHPQSPGVISWSDNVEHIKAYAAADGSPLRSTPERQEVVGAHGAVGRTAPHAGETLGHWASEFGVWRNAGETVESLRARVAARWGAVPNDATIGAAMSPNCASCGDVINERYERVEIVDGQRHHGLCADRVRALAAERAPKVTADDPYARHQKREAMHLQACRDFEFNPSYRRGPAFSADTVPSGYREKFGAHPWSNDDDV
jgi:hypothetical protein